MYKYFAKTFHKKIFNQYLDRLPILVDSKVWPKEWSTIDYKEYPRMKKIELKRASFIFPPLDSILKMRHTTREFLTLPISLDKISSLLEYSVGLNVTRNKNSNNERRYYPSGGALYPLEVYVYVQYSKEISAGLYHYNVKNHLLENLLPSSAITTLKESIYPWATDAPVTFFISSIWNRNFKKYDDYGYPIVLLEAGHIGQNMQLVGEALGLRYCTYVGFNMKKINNLFNFEKADEECVLYVASFGESK